MIQKIDHTKKEEDIPRYIVPTAVVVEAADLDEAAFVAAVIKGKLESLPAETIVRKVTVQEIIELQEGESWSGYASN